MVVTDLVRRTGNWLRELKRRVNHGSENSSDLRAEAANPTEREKKSRTEWCTQMNFMEPYEGRSK